VRARWVSASRARVRVVEDRRRTWRRTLIDRKQVRAVARLRITGRARDGLFVLVVVLGERSIEELDDRNVQPVEPEHRLIRLVPVVVPRHRRRDDEVAVVHPRPLAVHGRGCAVALEYEAERALGVAMGRCDFARQHELDPGIEIGRDLRLAAQPGILEDEHAPLGFFCRNPPPGLDHRGPNIRERPRGRLAAADRFGCDEFRERPPQRRHVLLTDALVERQTLRRLSG
jgi:hypothetical protein